MTNVVALQVDANLGETLAVLKEWTHVNCQTTDERKADDVQDDVLRDMVLRSMEALRVSRPRGAIADDDLSDDEESAVMPILPVLAPKYAGGEVTFIFHVSIVSRCFPHTKAYSLAYQKKKGALDSSTSDSTQASDS